MTAALRRLLDDYRARAVAGQLLRPALEDAALAQALTATLDDAARPRLRAVYNLTGTVLHTNLAAPCCRRKRWPRWHGR